MIACLLIGESWVNMNYYVARQPIFDANIGVYGYELLYRSGEVFNHLAVDGDTKTMEVIQNTFLLIGLDQMTRGRKAFINFTRNLITEQMATILPPSQVVIEIVEDINPDDSVLEACQRLKKMGYTLALDDFVYEPRFEPFLEFADIIKVDFLVTNTARQRQQVMGLPGVEHAKFLAEKVETHEDFVMAVNLGYDLFQGYFFEKPSLMKAKDIPISKQVYIRLLQELQKTELDVDRLESIIHGDPSITVKLLRFINSSAFCLRHKVHSIKQTLVLLGPEEWRKWIALVVMHGLAGDKTDELIIQAISRAYQCEHLAPKFGLEQHSEDLFLVGLLSLIDVMLEQPMEHLMNELHLPDDIRDALLNRPGLFKDVLTIINCYERGSWAIYDALCSYYRISNKEIVENYWGSLKFAYQLTQ